MIILGIDPGLDGALVWMRTGPDAGILHVCSMPFQTKARGRGRQVDSAELSSLLRRGRQDYAYVEAVGAHRIGGRQQGGSSMFSFGWGAGVVDGVLAALKIPREYVTPQAWKAHARLIGRPKDAALALVRERFPEVSHLYRHGRGNGSKDAAVGKADATLIADYGRQQQTLGSRLIEELF